jgi:serine/threonine-protein kinase ATR
MVLLGAAVRPGNHREIKLQGLVGWQLLVKALSTEAPVQLGGVVNQVVVTLLEGLQEGGQVGAAAARVIEELITACRSHFPQKIRSMPPLPQRLLELRHINTMLQEARGSLTTQQHVELLLVSLGDEALSVRSTALQELREVLSSQRTWLLNLKNNPNLEMRLLRALLESAEPGANSAASLAAQQACAECLGMLGAIDPSRVKIDPQDPVKRCATEAQLAIEVVTKHLVRLLKTAPNLQTLDSTTLAIQEVLRSHASTEELRILNARKRELAATKEAQQATTKKGQGSARKTPTGKTTNAATTPQPGAAADSNLLFTVLPAEVQAIIRPYLDSKFSYKATGKKVQGVIFRPVGLTYRRWLALWLTQLIDTHVSGKIDIGLNYSYL